MGINEVGPQRFLVEWYGPRAPACPINETAGRLNDGAASIAAHGETMRVLMVLAVPADDYTFGIFIAESAGAVAQVCVEAGAPAERISAAIGWPGTLDC
ncbi:hypothetical protein K3U94_21735 [Mycolicibacter heraklionensis]|nr:hypothetical protein [Mycolicibacter heraklionensis]QZA07514.1 hypothetical protein K3U94_21735 [Mycolicibacter heraklionensis]